MRIRVGIANYGQFSQFIEKLQPDIPEDVELVILNDLFAELEATIRRIEAEGSVDIFVGSGGNAEYLEKYLSDIPLVKVKVTGFDIMHALTDAKFFSDHVAIITYNHPLAQLAEVKDILNIETKELVYSSQDEVDYILQSLYGEGIRDVIGSAYVLERAKLYNMRGHFIWSLDGVRTALETAISMARNKKDAAEKAKKFNYLLDYAAEGIIITDRHGVITDFNTSAERILSRSKKSVIGRQCAQVLPNTELYTVMREKRAQFNKIQDLGNVKIVTNRSPIICSKEVIGALATFSSVSNIKSAEETIRRTQNFKGFVAKSTFGDMKSLSEAFLAVKNKAELYSRFDSTVLILGGSGTGKELFAQSIHNASQRKAEPFVAVNCAALPPSLLESELFGYEDGAFAGAKKGGKAGLFELAHEGTLFLDEVSEIPLKLQARLLRALEEKEFFRLGGDKVIPVNVRIIATSNRDLWQMVQTGTFREDLYYRINVLEIHLPELKQRREDIPLLISDFIAANRGDLTRAETEAICGLAHFKNYDWPGNIRELRNVIERFCVQYAPGTDPDVLARDVLKYHGQKPDETTANERADIIDALKLSDGNRVRTASILGVSRTTLWRKMREYGLDTEQK